MSARFTLNLVFWDGPDPARRRNCAFARRAAQEFVTEATGEGLDIRLLVFDFSETPALDGDTFHVSFPRHDFRKSEKLNALVEHNRSIEPDFLAVIDSDVVIRSEDRAVLIRLMKGMRQSHFYVCPLDDVECDTHVDFDGEVSAVSAAPYRPRVRSFMEDLGGLFVVPFGAAADTPLFDERFTAWGGEDNAASFALQTRGLRPAPLFLSGLHLPHASAEAEVMATEQYTHQLEHLGEYQRALPLDGVDAVTDRGTLSTLSGASLEAAGVDALVDAVLEHAGTPQDEGGTPEEKEGAERAIRSLVGFFGLDVLRRAGELERGGDRVEAVFVVELVYGSLLNRRVADILNRHAEPGQVIDGGRLFSFVGAAHGGRDAAASQAHALMTWLCQLRVLETTADGRALYRFHGPAPVPASSGELVLDRLCEHLGSPGFLPVDFLRAQRLVDLAAVVEAAGEGRYGRVTVEDVGGRDCLVIRTSVEDA